MKKSIALLCAFLLIVYAAIAYLTYTTLVNEEKAAEIRQLDYARLDSDNLHRLVDAKLEQIATRLRTLGEFLTLQAQDIDYLVEHTPIIQSIFVINQRRLVYPPRNAAEISENDKQLIEIINPFVEDNSSLLQHASRHDDRQNRYGWYVSYEKLRPILIFWQQKDSDIIVYIVSYTAFRGELIADLDQLSVRGQYRLYDNGQLLVSNQRQGSEPTKNYSNTAGKAFSYPLQHWSVNHLMPPAKANYLPTILSALAFCLVTTAIALAIYRYMRQRIKMASQQVQFVGQVSHELKTPLTNIRLYAEMLGEQLKDHPDSPPESQRYLSVIEDESLRLTRLIQNVLNFSRAPQPHRQAVYLLEVFDQLERLFTPALANKQLTIRRLLKPSVDADTHIDTDPDMLMQMLSNFISNAEKYAPQGQYVDIEAKRDNTQTVISIRDFGPGIAKSEIKHITKPFYRINNHINEGVAGTGIGLTIAEQLATALGATLEIAPANPGMRFSLRFPNATIDSTGAP